MNLISTTDLATSGIAYSIVDDDATFGDDGELTGYIVVIDELYEPGYGLSEPTNEPLCDTNELSDDHGRWEHLRDSHHSEMLGTECRSRPQPGDDKLDYGAMSFWAVQRERRVANLVDYMRRMARKPNQAQVRRLRNGIRQRYVQSIQLIVQRKHDEWWLLYLTKAQYQYLMRCIARLERLIK